MSANLIIVTMLKIAILVVAAAALGANGVEFEIKNREGGPVWVGILGNSGKPHLANGGFVLETGQSRSVNAPDDWAGRFWARTWCDPNSKHCQTGDCGPKIECNGAGGVPPASLAEITLNGYGGIAYYDISLVDGFNIPIAFEPVGGQGDGGRYSCKRAACNVHLNDQCPQPLQLRNNQGVIGCKSACVAFNTHEYCCRGAFNDPHRCKAGEYANFFKQRCPDAYSYAYDDQKSTFTCKANKYIITFGM